MTHAPTTAMQRPAGLASASLATAIMMLLVSTPASAETSMQYFNGVSIGLHAGWEERKIEETVLPDTINGILADKRDGSAFGGHVGYDHQRNRFVIGVEAGFNPGGKTLSASIPGGAIELDSKSSAELSVRGGVTLTPRLLAYGRIGYAVNCYRIRGLVDGSSAPVASASESADGIVFGAGFEYALTSRASVRTEYRHRELDGSLSSNQLLAGVTLRF